MTLLYPAQKQLGRLLLFLLGAAIILLILWQVSGVQSVAQWSASGRGPFPQQASNGGPSIANNETAEKSAAFDDDGYGKARNETSVTKPSPSYDFLDSVGNETLGVQKVFAINLPSRLDKRDDITLAASVSEFRVDWVEGIKPEDLNPHAYPYNWNHDFTATEYACRRAHVNAIHRIVDERLGSAIIMEDDIDWDVPIKTQLKNFALASRSLQGALDTPTNSPYGDDWDLLWLGHCGIRCKLYEPYYLTPNDPTVLPPRYFAPYFREPPPLERPEHDRLSCKASDGVCMNMYAVSYRGAQRILSALSVNPIEIADKIDVGAQIDVALGRMCDGFLRCLAPFPSITGGYRKSSDIHNTNENHPPSSYGVMYSTLMNINRILGGITTVLSTFNDIDAPEAKPGDILSVLPGNLQPPVEKPIAPVPPETESNNEFTS